LDTARTTLEAHHDWINAAHARLLAARRLLLIGHVGESAQILDALDATALAPAHQAIRELAAAGIAMRRIRARMARADVTRAAPAATRAGISGAVAYVDHAFRVR